MVISPWRQTTGAWHAPVFGRQGEAEDALRRNLQVSGVALGERKTCLQVAFLMALLSKVLLRYS